GWAAHVMWAWVLISLALVVSIVAQIHGRLGQLYGAARSNPQRPVGLAGQALLYAGHILLVAGAYRWLSGAGSFQPDVAGVMLLIYAGGIAANLAAWRRAA
ncbi:MAG: hypothetical protein ACREU7_02510, partial [Burkholderiales bacterium]